MPEGKKTTQEKTPINDPGPVDSTPSRREVILDVLLGVAIAGMFLWMFLSS